MRSLRTRLLSRTASLLVLTLSGAAVALYLLMRASLLAEFDAALLMEARSVSSHVEQIGNEIKLEFDVGQLPEYSRTDFPHYFQIWKNDGHSAAKSNSLGTQDLEQQSDVTDVSVNRVVLPNGNSGRQIVLTFRPRLEEDDETSVDRTQQLNLTLAVARDTSELDSTLRTLAGLLLIVTTATVVASVVILSGIVRHELEPLNSLASAIERVGRADLSERIQLDKSPQEMAPVVQRLNELLGRLDETLAREKAFTAEVAHELRTPLAGLQTALEVCGSKQREPQVYQNVIQRCLRITDGMNSMVNNLLTLARADARQLTAMSELVEIGELVRECWLPFEEQSSQRQLAVEWVVNEAKIVQLDCEKTKVVLKNLFENAVLYAGQSGWIRVTVADQGSRTIFTIANNGCTLQQADLVHLFDRFWRGDEARSDAGLHCGLGLSLCQKVMDVLGGTIEAQVEDGVFSVRAVFPTPPVGLQGILPQTLDTAKDHRES